MAPKRLSSGGRAGAKRPKLEPGQPPEPAAPAHPINAAYHQQVLDALQMIHEQWPGLQTQEPLDAERGHIAPYNADVYTKKWASDAGKMHYQCGINFLWQNSLASVLPFVPICKTRVDELMCHVTPGLLKFPIVIRASWSAGADLPRGSCVHISPDEWVHAVIFKVAAVISSGVAAEELEQWRQTLLSVPAVFVRIDSDDKAYAEANSLRQEASAFRRAVEHSARQLVFNIWGLKARKEASMGKDKTEISAQVLADFWRTEVRVAAGNQHMHKKSTFDTCLTLYKRVFSIPECAELVASDEARCGPDSVWNSLFKLQEVVYRCGTARKISWLMTAVQDWILTERVNAKDVTVASLKTGAKSISDIALMQLSLRDYLLGPWMDAQPFPPYMKSKCREIFDTRASYRTLYMPVSGNLDNTWLFSWPKFGSRLVNFLESVLYNPTGHEEFLLRQAVKNSNTPQEIMSWKPWGAILADLQAEVARSAEGEEPIQASTPVEVASVDADSDAEERTFFTADESAPKAVQAAADRLERQLVHLIVEPPSVTALQELLASAPLATIKPAPGGQCLILIDCNVFGEADSQPHLRSCPMPQELFKKWLHSIRAARGGSSDTPLEAGDIYMCFNGTKDRKRNFTKPLGVVKTGKDPDRTVTQVVLVHMTEDSWRERRGRHLGRSKLTQLVYICSRASTLKAIPRRQFATYVGSTKADVVGPVALDSLSSLPTMDREAKTEYLGKRRVATGGHRSDESNDEDDPAEAKEEEHMTAGVHAQPISFHALPINLVMDFVRAFQIRHVVDFTPTPLPLPLELMKQGVSYFGVCGTEAQRDYIKQCLHEGLLKEILDPASPLHDKRLCPVAEKDPEPSLPKPDDDPEGEEGAKGEEPEGQPGGRNLNVALLAFMLVVSLLFLRLP